MKRILVLVLSWGAVVAMCAVIFHFSAASAVDSANQSSALIDWIYRVFGVGFGTFFVRKAAHIFEFIALGFLAANAFYQSFGKCKHLFWSLPFGVMYAISDEVHQLFVPGRAGQVRDVCIDFAGILCGSMLMFCIIWIIKRLRERKNRGKEH